MVLRPRGGELCHWLELPHRRQRHAPSPRAPIGWRRPRHQPIGYRPRDVIFIGEETLPIGYRPRDVVFIGE